MQHISYRGDAEAITDLIGGRVHVYFATLAGSVGFIRAGALRALAVTTAQRSPVLTDVEMLRQLGDGSVALDGGQSHLRLEGR
jgi:tripartite-type tricarboxylate transporter receptor subunit TctC